MDWMIVVGLGLIVVGAGMIYKFGLSVDHDPKQDQPAGFHMQSEQETSD